MVRFDPTRLHRSYLVLIIMTAAAYGCHTRRHEVPTFLNGVWTTTNARYRDRHFEINGRQLTVGIGDDQSVSYEILGVDSNEDGRNVRYTLFYVDEGVETPFSFRYDATRGVIQLMHQKGIEWRRKES